VTREALTALGLVEAAVGRIIALTGDVTLEGLAAEYGSDGELAALFADLGRYQTHLQALGIAEWVRLDLKIVRGLAYYTGIVFELFDARRELRAICGGGRYDNLLVSLGGVDLPALGFGMGDVVLTELLRERGYLQEHASVAQPDFWIAAEAEPQRAQVAAVATVLRRAGASVEYALREQSLSKQRKASHSAGATYFVTLAPDFAAPRRVSVEPFGETADPPLAARIAEPITIELLVEAVRNSPELLSSRL